MVLLKKDAEEFVVIARIENLLQRGNKKISLLEEHVKYLQHKKHFLIFL